MVPMKIERVGAGANAHADSLVSNVAGCLKLKETKQILESRMLFVKNLRMLLSCASKSDVVCFPNLNNPHHE